MCLCAAPSLFFCFLFFSWYELKLCCEIACEKVWVSIHFLLEGTRGVEVEFFDIFILRRKAKWPLMFF
ncbi:unnamed protein product [Coffea canephora]|uniref:Secreted protein n=1 Tax=Coffea canephora TaxID=49390 RepID=A0A068VFU0_COFCA|nr:unnamed protein product [Coffea canephora]